MTVNASKREHLGYCPTLSVKINIVPQANTGANSETINEAFVVIITQLPSSQYRAIDKRINPQVITVGAKVGTRVDMETPAVGLTEGNRIGEIVGEPRLESDGFAVGNFVGLSEGQRVGEKDGT